MTYLETHAQLDTRYRRKVIKQKKKQKQKKQTKKNIRLTPP